jgi:putative DNA primase/helicase
MSTTAAAQLNAADLRMFANLRISAELLAQAGIRRVTDAEAREEFGIRGDGNMDGIIFPYINPSDDHRVTARLRRDNPEVIDGELKRKYICPFGDRRILYFPPGTAAFLTDPTVPVVLVESEKAALALTAWAARRGWRIVVIAMGGCWGWRATIGKTANPSGEHVPEKGPTPGLEHAANGRKTFVLLDVNVATNEKVRAACTALVQQLQRQRADLVALDLPSVPSVNGPDDFVVLCGDEAMALVFERPQGKPRPLASSDWPDPSPLGDELPPVEPFDSRFIPGSFRPLIEDVSERMQIPQDYAAAITVVALAGCVGRRASIRPKAVDHSWRVTPNIWGANIAPPGYMKSPVLRSVTLPLANIEELWCTEHEQESEVYETEREVLEIKRQAWREESKRYIKKGGDPTAAPDNTIKAPAQKRLILTDSTFEKLHEILSDNPAGVLVIRDELTGWLAQLDKQGREGERAFYLQGWNGDGGFTIDRIGRGSIRVPAVCISLFGNIQPSRLRSYLSPALVGGPDDDGLFQRFQIIVWPDPPREWKLVDRAPDNAALAVAEKVFNALSRLSLEQPIDACFALPAQKLFFKWWTELEGKIRGESGVHPAMLAHLSKYRSLMPSLALLFALADLAAVDAPIAAGMTVGLDHARQAAGYCNYLESHARRIYACVVSPETAAARDLARHIKAGDLPALFSTRDVYFRGWSGLDSPERARAALDLLEDAAWVRKAEPSTSPSGGRPSETWVVNPKVMHAK